MIIKKMLVVVPLLSLLSGCVIVAGDGDRDGSWDISSDWEDTQKSNLKHINSLTLGAERTAVLTQMGNPSFTEAFQNNNGNIYTTLFYRTHKAHGDGKTTKDETTPLVFKNDKLIGWGNDALQRIH